MTYPAHAPVPQLSNNPDATWYDFAACKDADPEIFFPPINEETGRPIVTSEDIAAANAFCDRCPVIDTCRETAIAKKEVGWWGGTSGNDRRKIRVARFHATRNNN